jgi:hypothetical protein
MGFDSAACWRSGFRSSWSGHQNWFDLGAPWAIAGLESTKGAMAITMTAKTLVGILDIGDASLSFRSENPIVDQSQGVGNVAYFLPSVPFLKEHSVLFTYRFPDPLSTISVVRLPWFG